MEKEFYDKLKEEQVTNYNQKLNLCLQAEAVKSSQDWKRTTEELYTLATRMEKDWPCSAEVFRQNMEAFPGCM